MKQFRYGIDLSNGKSCLGINSIVCTSQDIVEPYVRRQDSSNSLAEWLPRFVDFAGRKEVARIDCQSSLAGLAAAEERLAAPSHG